MKKRILSLALVVVMVALVAAGSMAYFKDTEQKTNVMTIGDVDIRIEEKMHNGTAWVDYDANQILYPVTQEKASFNKSVYTYNDSDKGGDVYIRTIVTCPANMYDDIGMSFNSGNNIYYKEDGTTSTTPVEDATIRYAVDWEHVGTYTIDGEQKSVFVCTVKDNAAVAKGDYVYSLAKVWLYDTVTQERVAELNLANAQFEIDVLSQAIQAKGLTHAEAMTSLGAISDTNLSAWFD